VTALVAATVIIVNYNGAHLLPGCLDALARQRDDAPDFDTVVVDNGSSDGSVALLARDFPWARVIVSSRNLGFAGGNNLALHEVSTPYAVLLNNDAAPEPHWLRNLLAEFDGPNGQDVGIVTGKILFMPKFMPISLQTSAFHPGPQDTRELGVRVYRISVDGADVTDKVLWEQAAYGPEGSGVQRFRWTRPAGQFLVPVARDICADGEHLTQPAEITITVAAESAKDLSLEVDDMQIDARADTRATDIAFKLRPGTAVVDVVNNAGSIVLSDGSGADRGFQEVDIGQYDEPAEVFAACGNGMALRTVVGRELGWFDDAFFMYYEDTDLSWRWRSRGWTIRYVPVAVLRHIHAASSKEWSPRWIFHVDRNRLLMLTKNATPGLAASAVGSYARRFAAGLVCALLDATRSRRRPTLREDLLRAQILRSYVRQAPRALRERRQLRRHAVVPASELQNWLVTRR
jgi:GT2 family glycosyltransferase